MVATVGIPDPHSILTDSQPSFRVGEDDIQWVSEFTLAK